MGKKTGTFLRGRLRLTIDPTDAETPAMVYVQQRGRHLASGTWHCVCGEGDVEGYELTAGEMAWIVGFEDAVEDAFAAARPEGWDQ
jgi:hypothetical protein